MNTKKTPNVKAFAIWSLSFGLSHIALADKGKVSLKAPQKASQEREDYQECVASVIKKYQPPRTPLKEKRMEKSLAACRDRYPAAYILAECKKSMTAGYKDSPADLRAGLKSCQAEYRKYSFNPKSAVPFVIKEDKSFFAGVGLNQAAFMRESEEDESKPDSQYMGENFGNFSCEPLFEAMFNDEEPEYILFGNDPHVYAPLQHVPRDSFLKSTGLKAGKEAKVSKVHPEFGEIDYNGKSKELLNFFPTSYCFFDRKIGQLYEGIKIYYLLDRPSKSVTPYFGTAFYKEKTAIPAQKLAEEIKGVLGADYQISQPKPNVYLISVHKDYPLDSEGDPKNVCQKDLESPYVASVVARENSVLAAYSLVANTANLCRFGDRVASRFLKKGSVKPSAEPSTEPFVAPRP